MVSAWIYTLDAVWRGATRPLIGGGIPVLGGRVVRGVEVPVIQKVWGGKYTYADPPSAPLGLP